MIDLDTVEHHPAIEELVDILGNKTQNTDRGFFRVEVAYFLSKMAASMRATIKTKDRGDVPVNVYALALATSGFGKGHSVNILETEFLAGFKQRFMAETFPGLAEDNLWKMAIDRAVISGKTEEEEKQLLDKSFQVKGAVPFTFSKATPAAVQQVRQKLLMGGSGAINLQIDEIGSNLVGSTDILNVFLELYDQGMIKESITKNTHDNSRDEELDGKTPTNALLFGTPSKLLDGGQVEDALYSFLDTGYARRCLFAWGEQQRAAETLTPAEIYFKLTQPQNDAAIKAWANHFTLLADPNKFGWEMNVSDAVGIELLTYKIDCENLADGMAEHEEIRKAEMSHRYFKALKLAGALAFVDESTEITMDHLYASIKLVEESGAMFQKLMTREKAYVKLAKYIVACGTEVTHADLFEALPFYKQSTTARNEMMTLAQAWGYKQHIVIKKRFEDGIELFTGETLEETNIDQMILSYSNHFAKDYQADKAPFDKLHLLTQAEDMHWCNHHFDKEHRLEENAIPGVNMVVLDVDGGVKLDMVHDLLKEYRFMTYTTKRHTEEDHRFRLIMPINYVLQLDHDDYKEFMNGIMQWLPFETDFAANQRSKKWMSNPAGTYHYNLEGDFLDALKFLPKTSKNEQYQKEIQPLQSLDNLERWFAQRIGSGNRNNQILKYALALLDTGMNYGEVEAGVFAFNAKLVDGLTEDEIRSTILQTVAKKYTGTS